MEKRPGVKIGKRAKETKGVTFVTPEDWQKWVKQIERFNDTKGFVPISEREFAQMALKVEERIGRIKLQGVADGKIKLQGVPDGKIKLQAKL